MCPWYLVPILPHLPRGLSIAVLASTPMYSPSTLSSAARTRGPGVSLPSTQWIVAAAGAPSVREHPSPCLGAGQEGTAGYSGYSATEGRAAGSGQGMVLWRSPSARARGPPRAGKRPRRASWSALTGALVRYLRREGVRTHVPSRDPISAWAAVCLSHCADARAATLEWELVECMERMPLVRRQLTRENRAVL